MLEYDYLNEKINFEPKNSIKFQYRISNNTLHLKNSIAISISWHSKTWNVICSMLNTIIFHSQFSWYLPQNTIKFSMIWLMHVILLTPTTIKLISTFHTLFFANLYNIYMQCISISSHMFKDIRCLPKCISSLFTLI